MKLTQTVFGIMLALTAGMVWAADATTTDMADKTAAQETGNNTSVTEAAANTGTVARAAFTSSVDNREPADKLSSMTNDKGEIMYFTELRGMAGHSVTHRWEHNGKVMAEVPFDIAGNRWRVYSSKQLNPDWTGEWKASVISATGETLSVSTFNYKVAPEAPASSTEAAPATSETTVTQ